MQAVKLQNKGDMQKILVFDIETTPAKVWTWGLYEQNVIKVIEQPFMLCFSYQWLGDKTKVVALPDFSLYKKNKKDDREVVKALRDLLDQADVVLGQNSDKFDIKWFNTRCITHHLPPPSPYKTIDTLKVSRKYFKWLSNKLDYVGEQLGHGNKMKHEGFGLWEKCIEGDLKAWNQMKRYNKRDVDLTADVYLEYLPWITQTTAIWSSRKECPECKSVHTQRRGELINKLGRFQRHQCMDCSKWFTGTKIIEKV
jgi:DNA polymerase elongation subunit (family B)